MFKRFALLKRAYFTEIIELTPPLLLSPKTFLGDAPMPPEPPCVSPEVGTSASFAMDTAEAIKRQRQEQVEKYSGLSVSKIRKREFKEKMHQYRQSVRVLDPATVASSSSSSLSPSTSPTV